MITKIKSIGNLAVFRDFNWDKSVLDSNGKVCLFQDINILYGRNYSGKTSLSRIVRALETEHISDKYENPAFSLLFKDGTELDQNNLNSQGKKVRVFNEDFVRENLRFITNPDDSIEPFAILGENNNKIEMEIEALESELGSNEDGKETGLYANQTQLIQSETSAGGEYRSALASLDKQLGDKATDRKIGIKYKPERYGDQNYTKPKLENDIATVIKDGYLAITNEVLVSYERLINENKNDPIPPCKPINLQLSSFVQQAEKFVTKKISASDKIEELVKDAILNRWVNEGRRLHKETRESCAFCGNAIDQARWGRLERHFDEESDELEKGIDDLISRIENEKKHISSVFQITKGLFYSTFHQRVDEIEIQYKSALKKYCTGLDSLLAQLKVRKDDIINAKEFSRSDDSSSELITVLDSYENIRSEANGYTNSLSTEQSKAREALRLREVSDFISTIKYADQLDSISKLKHKLEDATGKKNQLKNEIAQKEQLIEAKRRELNDEEKGALKVNEYLNSFFGHRFLSLEAINKESDSSGSKKIQFEVIRDGKKAYHLSEGECSLLAFCYFLAKLNDIDTKGSKPIVWIDDPISSLDGNHIFFVYSLLISEIVSKSNFEQLFVSTHNLDFLKYLRRLAGRYLGHDSKMKDYGKAYFVVQRQGSDSTISLMPKYLKEYVTEFNYLFHQIYKCAFIDKVDDHNFTTFYNFGNNARKFLELYLYYKYPDDSADIEKLERFFGSDKIPAILTDRINNEYSHLSGVFERGATQVEVPEMKTVAQTILDKLKADDEQYTALLKSIGVNQQINVAKEGGG